MDVKRTSNESTTGQINSGYMISIEELKKQQIALATAQKVLIQRIKEDNSKDNKDNEGK